MRPKSNLTTKNRLHFRTRARARGSLGRCQSAPPAAPTAHSWQSLTSTAFKTGRQRWRMSHSAFIGHTLVTDEGRLLEPFLRMRRFTHRMLTRGEANRSRSPRDPAVPSPSSRAARAPPSMRGASCPTPRSPGQARLRLAQEAGPVTIALRGHGHERSGAATSVAHAARRTGPHQEPRVIRLVA